MRENHTDRYRVTYSPGPMKTLPGGTGESNGFYTEPVVLWLMLLRLALNSDLYRYLDFPTVKFELSPLDLSLSLDCSACNITTTRLHGLIHGPHPMVEEFDHMVRPMLHGTRWSGFGDV